MRVAATPASTLTWKPIHGGFRGTSRDGLREYHVQPASIDGWWARQTLPTPTGPRAAARA